MTNHSGAQTGDSPLIAMRGITKTFPGVRANDHIDLDIYGGEIHALLGENGAGKQSRFRYHSLQRKPDPDSLAA